MLFGHEWSVEEGTNNARIPSTLVLSFRWVFFFSTVIFFSSFQFGNVLGLVFLVLVFVSSFEWFICEVVCVNWGLFE